METTAQIPLELYTEMTPNPESMKFMTNQIFLLNDQVDFRNKESVTNSDLANDLFEIPFVQGVFISNNFVTITKKPEYDWFEIIPELKEAVKKFVLSGKKAVVEKQPMINASTNTVADDPESKIKEMLEKYVKPAVEMDGGHIEFKSFADGVVTLALQGSCSGCPSSAITLKSGIEGLLMRMIPEVKEVVAEAE